MAQVMVVCITMSQRCYQYLCSLVLFMFFVYLYGSTPSTTVALFVLYCILCCNAYFCVSTLRATLPSQIPCLGKLTWPIKPDSDCEDRKSTRLNSSQTS